MDKIFNYIDANKAHLIDNLAKAVEIKSVSAWPECRPEIVKMVIFEFISSNHLLKKSSLHSVEIMEIYSHAFLANVEVTVLLKKLLNS